MFTLKIETDNAAFGDGNITDERYELARILREVAKRLESGEDSGAVRDVNGNKVGQFSL